MPLTVTPNEEAVVTALRAFLLDVIPSGFEVIQAQGNRVPEPRSPNFVLTTPGTRTRLSTNKSTLDTFGQEEAVIQATQFDYQLDVHGDLSGDAVQAVTTMMRDPYGADFFAKNSPGISPLYAKDPKQLPFINAEQQYENRWVVEVCLQADPEIVFPQQSATTLTVVTKSVEAEFPAS